MGDFTEDDPNEPNHHIQEFFRSIGQDPTLVCIDDLDSRGYYTFVTGADGGRLYYSEQFHVLREFHEWASTEQWLSFIDAAIEQQQAMQAKRLAASDES